MRRNLLTSILWFSAIVLFLLHVLLMRKQDDKQFSELVSKREKEVVYSTVTGKKFLVQ